MRRTGVDRALIALLGLLLLAGGVLTLVRSLDGFGPRLADDPLLSGAETRFVERNSPWPELAAVAVAVLLALLALRWLFRQLRTQRVGLMDLEPDPRRGATTLHASAVTTAVRDEIEGYRGVRSASARLLNDPRLPDLLLQVDLDPRADIAATRTRIEQEAVAHTRQALGLPDLPTRLTLRPAR